MLPLPMLPSREFPLKFEILFVAALFLFVTFAATYRLTESPGTWYDEGYLLQSSQNLALYGTQGLQTAPGVFASTATVSSGFPVLAPVALSFKLFGTGMLQARGVMVIYLLAFCAAVYALMRQLFGPRAAILSLVALVGFAELYGNGKAVLGEVPGLFYLAFALLVLDRLERSGYANMRLYALSGLFLGLCAVTKPIFIPLLLALALVYLTRFRRIRLQFRGVLVSLCMFVIPVIIWLLTQFGSDVTFSDILNFYINPYDVGDVRALALQNLKRFVTELTPLYTLILVTVWGVSLYLRRKAAASVELAAFVYSVLILLSYLRMEGWYRYLFPATMVALAFLAPSTLALYGKCAEVLKMLRRFPWMPYVLITALFVAQTYQMFTTSYVAAYFNGSRTRDLETYVGGLPEDSSVYFYNVLEAVPFAPSSNYYQYIKPHPTFGILGTETLPLIASGSVDYIVMTAGVTPDVDMSHYELVRQFNRYSLFGKK